jgi:hypothetical protein
MLNDYLIGNYPLFATKETYQAFANLLDASTDDDALHIIIRVQSNLTSDGRIHIIY